METLRFQAGHDMVRFHLDPSAFPSTSWNMSVMILSPLGYTRWGWGPPKGDIIFHIFHVYDHVTSFAKPVHDCHLMRRTRPTRTHMAGTFALNPTARSDLHVTRRHGRAPFAAPLALRCWPPDASSCSPWRRASTGPPPTGSLAGGAERTAVRVAPRLRTAFGSLVRLTSRRIPMGRKILWVNPSGPKERPQRGATHLNVARTPPPPPLTKTRAKT